MPVVFDATTLLLLLDEMASPPNDPATNKPVDRAQLRLQYLVDRLSEEKTKVVIPTPALSELLAGAGEAGPHYVSIIEAAAYFQIAEFDALAAVEAAEIHKAANMKGDKRGGAMSVWAKIKFDRQIIAIAKVAGADIIYSDDGDFVSHVGGAGIEVVRVADLPLPPEDPQANLDLGEPRNTEPNSEE